MKKGVIGAWLKSDTLRLILRRVILAALIIAVSLIQNSAGGLFNASASGFYPLIPLAVSIAMFEKEFAGMLFGLLAGALWDIASPVTDGVYALAFALAACACGLLTHYIFRNSFKSAVVFTVCFFVLIAAVNLVFGCLPKDPGSARYFITRFCPKAFLLTAAALPFTYYLVKFIQKRLRSERRTQPV